MTTIIDGLPELVAAHGMSIAAKATVVLLVTLIAAQAARRGRASVRHLLLTAGFGVLLVLPVVAALAPPLLVDVAPVRVLDGNYPADSVFLSIPVPVPEMPAVIVAPGAQPWDSTAGELLVLAWLGGVIVFAAPVLVGLVQVRRFRRTALPWAAGQRLVDEFEPHGARRQPLPATALLGQPLRDGVAARDGLRSANELRIAAEEGAHFVPQPGLRELHIGALQVLHLAQGLKAPDILRQCVDGIGGQRWRCAHSQQRNGAQARDQAKGRVHAVLLSYRGSG